MCCLSSNLILAFCKYVLRFMSSEAALGITVRCELSSCLTISMLIASIVAVNWMFFRYIFHYLFFLFDVSIVCTLSARPSSSKQLVSAFYFCAAKINVSTRCRQTSKERERNLWSEGIRSSIESTRSSSARLRQINFHQCLMFNN